MLSIDVSNHNNLSTELARAVQKGHNPDLVIVRGSLENSNFIQIAHDQCQEVQRRGMLLDIYGWAYATADSPADFVSGLLQTYGDYNPSMWWIDCEEDTREGAYKSWHEGDPEKNIRWLRAAVAIFREQGLGNKLGIYTGYWFWHGPWFQNDSSFCDLPLWAATDTKVADLSVGYEFGGWTHPFAAVQFDLSGPDLNLMDDYLYPDAPSVPPTEEEPSPEAINDVIDKLSRLGGLEHDVMPAWLAELDTALAGGAWKQHVQVVRDQIAAHLGVDQPEIAE